MGILRGLLRSCRLVCLMAAVLLALSLTQLKAKSPGNNSLLKIVATTMMIGDTVKQIVGSIGDVQVLMGSGIDPHTYTPVRSDIVAMGQADLVFTNGLHLESQLIGFFDQLRRHSVIVSLGDAINESLLIGVSGSDQHDPHIWMDVRIWRHALPQITKALCAARPGDCAVFNHNAARYDYSLDILDKYIRSAASTIDRSKRILLTAHDAFGYFGKSYGFRVEGIQGISTQSEAGVRRITDLIQLAMTRKIAAVFVESSVSKRNILSLIEGAQVRNYSIKIGGKLYSDSMGGVKSNADSYIKMIEHNTNTIITSLGGYLPAGGLAAFTRELLAYGHGDAKS